MLSIELLKSNMELIRNIVITSDADNPARFITSLDPVRIKVDSEMAITNLCHGGVFNIHEENNKIYFYSFLSTGSRYNLQMIKEMRGINTFAGVDLIPSRNRITAKPQSVTIPTGRYKSTLDICWAISVAIKHMLKLPRRANVFVPSADRQLNTIDISLDKIFLVIRDTTDTPWQMMGISDDQYERFSLKNDILDGGSFPAFVYANIVENSYIDGKLSRNLGIANIKNEIQWSFYQPVYPNYVPINVMQFSKILIELRDVNGKYIKFDPAYKTIITLSIRPSTIKRN